MTQPETCVQAIHMAQHTLTTQALGDTIVLVLSVGMVLVIAILVLAVLGQAKQDLSNKRA